MPKLFFAVFLIVGFLLLYWGYQSYQRSQESKAWPTVPGRVISAEVESYLSSSRSGSHHRHQRMYRANVVYEYTALGKAYTSQRVSFGDYSSSSPAHAEKIVGQYPPQRSVMVYYDPAAPASAVLEPGAVGGIVIVFAVGTIFFLVGIVGIFQVGG
jgi:hypothetical protein